METVTDRHGLEVLSLAQCLALLRSRPLGRLAYLDAGAPSVVPVNHLVDGSTLLLRTFPGAKLDAALLDRPVAFQLDDHDPARGTGWSVLVRGFVEIVDDPEVEKRYGTELDSWAMSSPDDAVWLRIVPEEVTGRRVRRPA